MTGKNSICSKLNSENGTVIIEATFVFPIMFIILFFLIYMGNAFYMKAQVESVVEQKAIRGAAYCADPILETMKETGKFPSLSALETKPYRYIFGGMNDVESKISNEVEEALTGKTSTFFTNMYPKITTAKSDIAKYNNYVVYSTFSVEVKYTIKFPISFLGESTPPMLVITSRAEAPVDDTAEFIRNTDMVIDVFSKSKVAQKISDVFGKINDFISGFAKK